MRILPILLALAFAAPAAAQDVWLQNGLPAGDDGSRASRDGFGAMILVTDRAEDFWRAWEGPTPPNLPTTDRAVRGRPVNGMVLFTGCQAGPEGLCNVTVEFLTIQPDGAPSGDPIEGRLWGGPPTPAGNIQLGEGSVALVVEPEDQAGRWVIRATVTDRVRGVTVEVEQAVTVDAPPASNAA